MLIASSTYRQHQVLLQVTKDVQFKSQHSKVSGTLYLEGEDHLKLLADAYAMFAHTNPMHGDVFPSVRRMEAEVVNMTASLLGKGESNNCAALLPRKQLPELVHQPGSSCCTPLPAAPVWRQALWDTPAVCNKCNMAELGAGQVRARARVGGCQAAHLSVHGDVPDDFVTCCADKVPTVCGSMTSGGTESILTAEKAV